jgi:hypothetical protein
MNLYLAESGGVWNAYFKERRETSLKYTAQAASHIERSGIDRGLFSGVNILQSFYYCDDMTVNTILPQCKSFLLDSGAYSFMNAAKNKKVNFDAYVDKYIDFINANKIDLFFELDIDSVIGLTEVEKIRAKIERKTGKQPIVVFHRERGKQYFIDMCKNYPYVAIGGMTAGAERNAYNKVLPWFINTAHEYGAKIHGLGYTEIKNLSKMRFDSVDSTAWISGNRFGSIYKFNGTTMLKYDKKQGQRIADHKTLARHNFCEWVKFAKYAETHF